MTPDPATLILIHRGLLDPDGCVTEAGATAVEALLARLGVPEIRHEYSHGRNKAGTYRADGILTAQLKHATIANGWQEYQSRRFSEDSHD